MTDLTTPSTTQVRTFELSQIVSGFIECETMDDLPANIQDVVYQALEEKSKAVELPLKVVMVRCDVDHDEEDPTKKFFLHIIASEVVVADERTINPMRLLQ